jgi:hypothetical protein
MGTRYIHKTPYSIPFGQRLASGYEGFFVLLLSPVNFFVAAGILPGLCHKNGRFGVDFYL